MDPTYPPGLPPAISEAELPLSPTSMSDSPSILPLERSYSSEPRVDNSGQTMNIAIPFPAPSREVEHPLTVADLFSMPPRMTDMYPRNPQQQIRRTRSEYSDPQHQQRLFTRSDATLDAPRPARVNIELPDTLIVQELRRSRSMAEHSPRQLRQLRQKSSFMSSTATLPVNPENFDFKKTLDDVVRRRDEAQILERTLGVVFRDLEVIGLGATNTFQPTVGSMFSYKTLMSKIQTARHPPIRSILTGFEGVVKPGEMLLVLGRPGSGCTTFLKTLANLRDEYYAVNGEVHYDSLTSEDIKKHYRGDVQYCPEDDIHFPSLTVSQTLAFAAKTRTPKDRTGISRSEYNILFTDILTTLFGLRHAMKTPVGDAVLRGVSGGEKKRVSIAECFATRARLGAWDNSTRGLDSSTALEYVRALRTATDSFEATTIVSIYQAGENLYREFDKVCLIYEGKMVYFGPASQARQYFIDMGYEPANRQTTSDFLVAVTDPKGRTVRPGALSVPRTADEFAQYFKTSFIGAANRDEMDNYSDQFVGKPNQASEYMDSAQAEHAKHARKQSPYMISIPMQVRAVMLRRVQIMRGNLLFVGMNTSMFAIQSLIIGSVFLNSPKTTSAFFGRGGAMFFALFFSALSALAELPASFSQRPIILRHKVSALYHPFVEALALTLVDVPITFVAISIFSINLYFMTGFERTAHQFFIFYLFVFITAIAMKAWFRTVAAASRSQPVATTLAGVCLLGMSIYTGYQIPKPTMIGALRWITYINPLRYSFEAILTNEFHTLEGKCSTIVPSGPGYENVTLANQVCTTVGSTSGTDLVDGARYTLLSFSFSYSNTWKNLGIMMAFVVGMIGLFLFFTEFNTATSNESGVVLFKQGDSVLQRPDADDEEAVYNDKPTSMGHNVTKSDIAKASPMTDIFTWQHVTYTVPISGGADRKLLSDVTGYVAPGKLTALMGESGAGKTTLLNVLAQRVDTGVITGDMFVNGQSLPKDFQAQTGYCQQMDTHMPQLSVRESLLFSAQLRRPASVPLEEKKAYVDKCLKICGLEAYADAIVGTLGVEHRKRTTIAVELAAKPKLLLFLDEPTSGLDSQSAWSIMTFLRSLADSGQAILCTIHQPSAELFQVFDRMLLLRKGGQTVYFGDLGRNATTLINYFERNGSRACLPDENPAEFMLDVIGAGATAKSAQDWHEIWFNSDEAKKLQAEVDFIHSEGRNRPPAAAEIHHEFATSWFYQVALLLKRNAQSYWRDPTYITSKIVLHIFGGLFVGFSFWQAKNSIQGTQNKLFSIFMVTILSVPAANQLQVPFIGTRTIYEIRERPSRMYSWSALITSQILIELPWNIFASTLLFCCWYWTVGYDSSRAPYTYLGIGFIFPVYYTTIGQAIAAMAPRTEIAALLFSFLFSFVLTFNGILQPFQHLGWWKWMYHLSPYTYLVEGLLGQAIGHQLIECAPVEYVKFTPPSGQTCGQYMSNFISFAGGYLTNPNSHSNCTFCGVRTTDQFLNENFNIFYHHRWRNVAFMFAFIVFNIACTYLFTYLFRIRKGSLLPSFKKSAKN